MAGRTPGVDPTVHRRRLRSELRKAREAAGRTQREVAAEMDWSPSKLIRIETGAVNISTNDLRALLSFYGEPPDRISTLVDMAKAAKAPTPWSVYRDVVPPEFLAFLGYESSASVIRNFEPLVVPGLLQTEEYARSVISNAEDKASSDQIEALVDLRIQRQERIFGDPAASTHFILDEAVLRRPAGSPDIMRRQIRHLIGILDEPHVTVHVIPFDVGLYSAIRIGYVLFEFPDPADEDILYIENPGAEVIVRENTPDDPANTPVQYLDIFNQLELIAPSEDTPAALEYLMNQLQPDPGVSWGRPRQASSPPAKLAAAEPA